MPSNYQQIADENVRRRGSEFDDIGQLLAEQLYSDKTHFLYELLQNAEDALARRAQRQPNSRLPQCVAFHLFADRLEVRYFGQPFDEQDVRAICDVLRGTKADDASQIGRFGIGFKSVYAVTSSPEIHSGDEHFRIERYIRPVAIAARSLAPGETLIVLPFDHRTTTAHESFETIHRRLRQLGVRTLLFLRHIEEISWTVNGATGGSYLREQRSISQAKRVSLVGQDEVGMPAEEWIVFQRRVATVAPNEDASVEIAFQLELENGRDNIVPVEGSHLTVFFPTARETHLGFLINGSYRTTPARDNVLEDDAWNKTLVKETALLSTEALAHLKALGLLSPRALDTLPTHAAHFPMEGFFRPFYDRTRTVLRREPLIPVHGGGFEAGINTRLSRSSELLELLSPNQIAELVRQHRPIHFVHGDITETRRPMLYRYLRDVVIEAPEIRPETVVSSLTARFMEQQADEWIVRLFSFLGGQRALWPELKQRRFLRLEGGRHVAPFTGDGRPNAYLPPSDETTFPIVARQLCANPDVLTFLQGLGLFEPDAVTEVLDQILPKYHEAQISLRTIPTDEHLRDVRRIFRAFKDAAETSRLRLIEQLDVTPWLRAINLRTGDPSYEVPSCVYRDTPELQTYFDGNPQAWFLDSDSYPAEVVPFLEAQIHGEVRINRRTSDATGYVPLPSAAGNHRRGRGGFDPDCEIDGLRHALRYPSLAKACFIWNRLLVPNARSVRGVVETASWRNFGNAIPQETYSLMGKLVAEAPWLPSHSGNLHRPCELSPDDLPVGFVRDETLATALHMAPAVLQEAASQFGVEPEQARKLFATLATHPEKVAEFLLSVDADEAIDAADLATKEETEGFNYADDFGAAFAKAGVAIKDDWLASGPITNPDRRRIYLQAEIQHAKENEPPSIERFQGVRRKVWEAKDTAVRTFLVEQYGGHCQVCEATFCQRNGEPYFEGLYLVSKTKQRWIDRPGNVLCLCPTCCAKFLHGSVEATDALDQVLAADPTNVEFVEIELELCGETVQLRFSTRHLLDLQELLFSD